MAKTNMWSHLDSFIQEKYIPLEPKIRLLIGCALIIIPILIFYFAVYIPKSERKVVLEKDKVTLNTEISKAKRAAENRDKHDRELAETKEKFAELSTRLPNRKEIPDLLRSISDLGKGAGLDFNSFSPGGPVARDFYAEIPVSISISGPYHNLGYFLDQVSKLNRIVTVNNISLGSPKQRDGKMVLSSSCRLVTYMFTNKKINTGKKK